MESVDLSPNERTKNRMKTNREKREGNYCGLELAMYQPISSADNQNESAYAKIGLLGCDLVRRLLG
jgi:hypothetical protein